MSRKNLEEASIEELIERARDGDHRALQVLFNRSRPVIRAWAAQQMGDAQRRRLGVSDVTQEVLKLGFEKFPAFDGAQSSQWYEWLKSILLNRIREMLRTAGRKKRDDSGTLSLDDPAMEEVPSREKSPSQMAAHREEQKRLIALISELPFDQGQAVLYRHLKGLTVDQVAARLGKTPNAIGGLLMRGLKALRHRMAGSPEGESGGAPRELEQRDDVLNALMEYLRKLEAGEAIDRDAFLATHAACADELRSLLDTVEQIRAIWDDPPCPEEP